MVKRLVVMGVCGSNYILSAQNCELKNESLDTDWIHRQKDDIDGDSTGLSDSGLSDSCLSDTVNNSILKVLHFKYLEIFNKYITLKKHVQYSLYTSRHYPHVNTF